MCSARKRNSRQQLLKVPHSLYRSAAPSVAPKYHRQHQARNTHQYQSTLSLQPVKPKPCSTSFCCPQTLFGAQLPPRLALALQSTGTSTGTYTAQALTSIHQSSLTAPSTHNANTHDLVASTPSRVDSSQLPFGLWHAL